MLTPERLREIKERCERATPGPWRVGNPYVVAPVRDDKCMLCDMSEPLATVTENGQTCHVHFDDRQYEDDWRDIASESTFETIVGDYSYDSGGVATTRADAEFIAHAREDVPALIAEVERLWEENWKLHQELRKHADVNSDL